MVAFMTSLIFFIRKTFQIASNCTTLCGLLQILPDPVFSTVLPKHKLLLPFLQVQISNSKWKIDYLEIISKIIPAFRSVYMIFFFINEKHVELFFKEKKKNCLADRVQLPANPSRARTSICLTRPKWKFGRIFFCNSLKPA
jgi:hypothetical protein